MSPVGLVVCRGCCCGSPAKNPGVDHEARLARLEQFADSRPEHITVKASQCLGPCEYADIVVVTPSPAARRNGARPVWFGFADDQALDLLCAWALAGGPGVAEPSGLLQLQEISRPPSRKAGAAQRASPL